MYDYRYEDSTRVNFIVDMQSFYASLEIVSLGLDPLTTPLVVVSKRANDGSGLVMSASHAAKELFGLKNVMRARELPKTNKLLTASPRMEYYIDKNIEINKIFGRYAAIEDIYSYSIDESLIDMTSSWKLFGNSYREVARKIQSDIKNEIGIQTNIGIAPTLTMAKIALDTDAKKHDDHIAEWKFTDIPNKLWPIADLTKVWSIGKQTALKLQSIGVNNIGDLARTKPDLLVKRFGERGKTLFALAWGVDRGIISQRETEPPREHGIGNSQILPKDYIDLNEIKLIITEIADQVISRMKKEQLSTNLISIGGNYSMYVGGHFGKQKRLKTHTANKNEIIEELFILFKSVWNGEAIRGIGISLGGLKKHIFEQGDLFSPIDKQEKMDVKDDILQKIQEDFGFKSLFRASSKLSGGTALYRAGLIGGHNAESKSDK
jgi:DNA polymerase V